MIYLLYSVYDSATKRYSPPMSYETLESLKRQIRVSASTDATLRLCPQDFQLIPIGQYDSINGDVLPWSTSLAESMPLLSVADVLDVSKAVDNEVQ